MLWKIFSCLPLYKVHGIIFKTASKLATTKKNSSYVGIYQQVSYIIKLIFDNRATVNDYFFLVQHTTGYCN